MYQPQPQAGRPQQGASRRGGRGGFRQFRGNEGPYRQGYSQQPQPYGSVVAPPYGNQQAYTVVANGPGAPPPYAMPYAMQYHISDEPSVSGAAYFNPEAMFNPAVAHMQQQIQVASAPQLDENSPDFCKALAKVAKPCPPWSIGSKPTDSLAEEVARLDTFIAPQQHDSSEATHLWDALRKASTSVVPQATLQYTGSNSWGFFPYKSRLSVAVREMPDDDASTAAFRAAMEAAGFVIDTEARDSAGARCLLVKHLSSGRTAVVRIGPATSTLIRTVEGLREFPRLTAVRQALNCLIVLLRQSKIIDDVDPAALCDEAAATMLLSIANSYPEVPSADRIIIDFFLTFGFKEHFATDRFSVDVGGMVSPIPKVHTDAVLSIIDPGTPKRNLAAGITEQKLTFIRSSFEYCYHVVSEFTKESNPQNRRGQSALSTMIGGEPYWPRVIELAKQHVEPYHSFLAAHKQAVFDEMIRTASRRSSRR